MANKQIYIIFFLVLTLGVNIKSFSQSKTAKSSAIVTATVVSSQNTGIQVVSGNSVQVSVSNEGVFQIQVENNNSITESFFCTKQQPAVISSISSRAVTVRCQNLSL
jgi:hypothetical protein